MRRRRDACILPAGGSRLTVPWKVLGSPRQPNDTPLLCPLEVPSAVRGGLLAVHLPMHPVKDDTSPGHLAPRRCLTLRGRAVSFPRARRVSRRVSRLAPLTSPPWQPSGPSGPSGIQKSILSERVIAERGQLAAFIRPGRGEPRRTQRPPPQCVSCVIACLWPASYRPRAAAEKTAPSETKLMQKNN